MFSVQVSSWYSFGVGLYLRDSGLAIEDILAGSYTNPESFTFDSSSNIAQVKYLVSNAFYEKAARVNFIHFITSKAITCYNSAILMQCIYQCIHV